MGDINVFPSFEYKSLISGKITKSDYNYGLLGSHGPIPDIIQDVIIGRFSVVDDKTDGVEEFENMYYKHLHYKMTPNVTLMSHEENTAEYAGCINKIWSTYTRTPDKEKNKIDGSKLSFNRIWGHESLVNNNDVYSVFNRELCGLFTYRGHGDVDGLYDWNGSADLNNITFNQGNINNKNLFPVMLNIACYTGKFDEPICFNEHVTRHTSGGAPSGVSLALGAAEESWTKANSYFIEQFFSETFSKPIDYSNTTFGMASIRAQIKTIQYWDPGSDFYKAALDNLFMYNWFGDPSLKIFVDGPIQLDQSNRVINKKYYGKK